MWSLANAPCIAWRLTCEEVGHDVRHEEKIDNEVVAGILQVRKGHPAGAIIDTGSPAGKKEGPDKRLRFHDSGSVPRT